ncbi:M1 family metallopeptidase [Cellulomonas cellasea]|uniref:M1 family metallopeptidase n=1 Tax=Cellulomonas cellasea TaxID=43670 RepID=UPI0009FF1D39|nr:M1 family metallopeptidase [Cellulomonas cellasea]
MREPSPTAGDPYAYGHGSRAFNVEHYDLELDYRVRTNRLAGVARLRVRAIEPLHELALDLGPLVVQQVTVAGAPPARHRHRAGRLVVRLVAEVPAGTQLDVLVRYAGTPRPVRSPWGEVGWEELEDGVLVASQPTGAPSWFPCNDRPDDKATYRTSVTVENPYRPHAHGTLVRRTGRSGATTWVFEESRPTSPYLATVQIGRYSVVELASDPVPQQALVPPRLAAAARTRLAHHGDIMRLFTRLFGPYPFATYTLVVTDDALEIPVEAQGMSVFGSNHLGGLGGDPAAGDEGRRLVPHELAHQWFGNAVSVAGWRHIWLNEGFACYAEWLWSHESGGPTADTLARRHHARLAALPQDLVLADPGPATIFDDRVYKRGALTLHALRLVLGDAAFWGLVRGWTARHAGGSASTDDFRAAAAEHARRSGGDALVARVDGLLADWLDAGRLPDLPPPAPVPVVSVTQRLGQLLRPSRGDAPS